MHTNLKATLVEKNNDYFTSPTLRLQVVEEITAPFTGSKIFFAVTNFGPKVVARSLTEGFARREWEGFEQSVQLWSAIPHTTSAGARCES